MLRAITNSSGAWLILTSQEMTFDNRIDVIIPEVGVAMLRDQGGVDLPGNRFLFFIVFRADRVWSPFFFDNGRH